MSRARWILPPLLLLPVAFGVWWFGLRTPKATDDQEMSRDEQQQLLKEIGYLK